MIRRLKAGIQRNSGFSLNVMTDDEAHEIHLATLSVVHGDLFADLPDDTALGLHCVVFRGPQ